MFRRLAALLTFAALLALCRPPVSAQTTRVCVLVVGGTPAGVAAAVAAARHGANVTLVAQRPVLGGILTDAMMDQWDLNVAPGGGSVQGGLFTEIHNALGDAFTPAQAAHGFGQLVAGETRIHLVVGARPIAATTFPSADGRVVNSVRFTQNDGKTFELAAQQVVDATDNGDVAALAGARYDVGRQDTGIDERMQAVTLMFTLRGVAWNSVMSSYDPLRFGPGGAHERRAWGYAKLMNEYTALSPDVVVRDCNFGREPNGVVTVNAINVLGVDGRSDADLARARALAQREAPHLLTFLRERLAGFERATLAGYADALYVRETRHFAGIEQLTADDVWEGTIPRDAIGLSSYPLDLHPVVATDKQPYAPIRHVYGIPFGTLVPRDLANLLIASPAISATHIAAGSARVIPTTIEEGEAAGVAAALAASQHEPFAHMARDPAAIAALRNALLRGGTVLTYRATSSGRTRSYGRL